MGVFTITSNVLVLSPVLHVRAGRAGAPGPAARRGGHYHRLLAVARVAAAGGRRVRRSLQRPGHRRLTVRRRRGLPVRGVPPHERQVGVSRFKHT